MPWPSFSGRRQLACSRVAAAASPVLRLMTQRDHIHAELDLVQRELQILRDQRAGLRPHKRPDYAPEQVEQARRRGALRGV